jgi:hypothetical protein
LCPAPLQAVSHTHHHHHNQQQQQPQTALFLLQLPLLQGLGSCWPVLQVLPGVLIPQHAAGWQLLVQRRAQRRLTLCLAVLPPWQQQQQQQQAVLQLAV